LSELFEQPGTALANVPVQAEIAPMNLIQQALSTGTSPEVIRELVTLQQSMERFNWEREERQSKIDFDNALNECQKQIGRIAPNVNRKDTNSWWADYAQLDNTVRPIYVDHGFSIAFSEVAPLALGKVRIKAELSRAGISKDYFREITPSTTGPKGGAMATATDADAIAGARAKRYLILDIFNISIGIDKIEKQGVPGTGLDAAEIDGRCDEIEKCSSREAIAKLYFGSMEAAVKVGDMAAQKKFIASRDKRLKEFEGRK
jgi:DNA-binding transcriptional MerR regulator